MDRFTPEHSDRVAIEGITDVIDGLGASLEATAVELEQLLAAHENGLTFWPRRDVQKVIDRCRLLARTNGETADVLRALVTTRT